ncbi:MAG TPA: DISARM system SNF2-like helicase DrmD [Caulobacteraceae bacterium]
MAKGADKQPGEGEFVELRGRQWLVEEVLVGEPLTSVRLSCTDDDAQGEPLEVVWDAEISPRRLAEDDWARVGRSAPDDPQVLAAHLRAVRWRSASAADRELLQAPFRAGIRLRDSAYQLLPLRKALKLPRVNLLIADDVGLGKTIEAGLIVRELLLRRRIDLMVIAAPPSMTLQWRDELENKFGLSFDVITRERVADLRRQRGFTVNPWTTGSRFIISHSLLIDETYAAGLRDLLGEFRARALFILDEAHHAAPSAGTKYAISSQLTKAVRELSALFEHRLFLTATPHNGHSNSFSALLEMLDPQRFVRGIPVQPKDLEQVMVRRLKSDLRKLDPSSFPERVVKAESLTGLSKDLPELDLSQRLAAYGALRAKRIARLTPGRQAMAQLAFVGLQQRLLSSIAAFSRTLKKHKAGLEAAISAEWPDPQEVGAIAARGFVGGESADEAAELGLEDEAAEKALEADEDAEAMAAAAMGVQDAGVGELKAELAAVEEMLSIAEREAARPDERVRWLAEWIGKNLLEGDGKTWNRRRLIVFTEYEDTRRWLQRRLDEVIEHTERAEDRIGLFTGATGQDRREEVKRAFNADPEEEPLRILICTDAAREGINLQTWCYDLIHLDLPWNPARLEQRNGRIDRKLQPAPQVFCRYFVYEQRPADVVLDALVKKTETIREQLGSAGKVIEDRVIARLEARGIAAGQEGALAREITDERDDAASRVAREEMADGEETRREIILRDDADLRNVLEASRERVGVDAGDLRRVAAAALSRAGVSLDATETRKVGAVDAFQLNPGVFGPDWASVFDDLRTRPRKRGERPSDWRSRAPVRAIAFQPPILLDGRDDPDTVQLHLEHRLVRRLLSRFLSQGFQQGLSRIAVIRAEGAQPHVVLLARLAVYGANAARLHEEVIPITAVWSDADRDRKPLRPFAQEGKAEERTLKQLDESLRGACTANEVTVARIQPYVEQDIRDLLPALNERVVERLAEVKADLAKVGEAEARSLTGLLHSQRARLVKASAEPDSPQLQLDFDPEGRREREADRRHWTTRLARLDGELAEEPDRLRRSYEVKASRVEPVGLVYLWPDLG